MDMDRYIGRLLDGRYEILEVIGTGGMAVVYKARCHRLNRLVAIKILKDELTQDDEFRRRFHAESQAVAMLSHPNIVSVYDVSTTSDADYIVMELIDGISLKQYMEKKGVLNWKETLHFAMQIGKALDHAHSRGIIHRDIKPHNVMVLKNGSVKVADFGIAQVMSKSNTLTKEALGSVHYISPEQAKGGRVDTRSDIYSLGVVMYEMMTGRPPFDGESPVAVAIQHINGKAVMPSTLNPNIPGGLEQIIMKAMAQNASQRYTTAKEMLYDMDEFRKDPTILFDYHNSSTGMDDATLIQSTAAAEPVQPVKTTAQKVVSRSTEPQNRPSPERKPAKRADGKKKRYREEIVEEKERGSRVATVAYIICALVMLVAVGVFIMILRDDPAGVTQNDTISVPNLLNKVFDELEDPVDYILEVERHSYSSEYEAGRVMSQSPKAGTRVSKGSKVTVVISEGPAPTVKTMERFVGMDMEQAKNYMVNTQGIDPNLILVYEEASSSVEAGKIIRTDPVEDEELVEGEPIYLWVSTGPSVKSVTMVDFSSDFYNEESAINWLVRNGFTNYDVEYVQSTKAPGKIVSQSISPGLKVDVTTKVILKVSQGSDPTTPPPVGPTADPEDYKTKLVQVALPDDIMETYTISVYRNGELLEEREIYDGTIFTEFNLSGKGVMDFEISLSTGVSWTIQVDFDATETTEDEAAE